MVTGVLSTATDLCKRSAFEPRPFQATADLTIMARQKNGCQMILAYLPAEVFLVGSVASSKLPTPAERVSSWQRRPSRRRSRHLITDPPADAVLFVRTEENRLTRGGGLAILAASTFPEAMTRSSNCGPVDGLADIVTCSRPTTSNIENWISVPGRKAAGIASLSTKGAFHTLPAACPHATPAI